MPGTSDIRIDKFLWAVRLYKTRSLAADACKKGRIIINNVQVKSSRIVVKDEIVIVKKLPVLYSYRIKDITGNRLPAKLVANYIEDLTSEEEKFKLKLTENKGFGYRERGTGRPTKKERRVIDRLNH
jgi:ribosome-associated heat shock protein Hsp15